MVVFAISFLFLYACLIGAIAALAYVANFFFKFGGERTQSTVAGAFFCSVLAIPFGAAVSFFTAGSAKLADVPATFGLHFSLWVAAGLIGGAIWGFLDKEG